ncbi:hypothetical protein Pmar_PMAR001189 [Perkinsus marinus ATCC 50983]|uniref:Uncharacterized protein n=1 Tax=Perkinsus marinus (strain ATCC 50983 / TXsc) TaxID=423536 RepID=C5KT41_PERM5|nr:hypothetical protein Pmar_PMAR001189 [Perkinsus marinus ATCC 50983]EER12391.1 hypothetical protein Pmar_PMAR001189 [Perkinsus marinus ATCC 50983]|eukprot:XP_002780596.1 hypothetical protein Pmar_PMAR001189 [Perkinsus marinus ATCC 50983]
MMDQMIAGVMANDEVARRAGLDDVAPPAISLQDVADFYTCGPVNERKTLALSLSKIVCSSGKGSTLQTHSAELSEA